jgi:4-hydroxy-tetrahydrodipicolinate synthase
VSGIIPPLSTPLTDDHDVDVVSLRQLVDFLVDAGVHGVFALGSTSEDPYLTDAQRVTVLTTAVAAVDGRVPVFAGTMATTAARAIERVAQAESAGADYVVVSPPFYALAGEEEIESHYRLVHEKSRLPVIAYDIPSRTGVKLSAPLLGRLARDGVVVGAKDSSGDIKSLRALVAETADVPGFAAMMGSEVLTDLALFSGAAGAVPGLANVDPHGYVRLHSAAVAGDWDAVRAEQRRLTRLFDIIVLGRSHGLGVDAAAYGAFKEALRRRGVIARAHTVPPQTPLPAVVRDQVGAALVEAGLVGAGLQ